MDTRWAGFLALLVACGGGKGDDSGGGSGALLEVANRYNVLVTTISGCENDPTWVQPWAEGPLTLSQDGADLVFDFGSDAVFPGTLDDLGRYTFRGDLSWNGGALEVENKGLFHKTADGLTFDGEFEIMVDEDEFETNNCTLTSAIEGYEVQGGT